MKPRYIAEGDSFCIENYNQAPPFSNFFPALAGVTGKPMWVFYTNRGQGLASFGVNNKDGSMLEFLPANKAYQATPLLGFRTFIKASGKNGLFVEPFADRANSSGQSIYIRPYELEIVDRDLDAGFETRVVYFGVPHESCPVLARSLTIKNISSKSQDFRVLDGLPRIVPFGMNDYLVKHMSRTIEAFAEVLNVENGVPFYKLKIEPQDRPEIKWLHAGFFSFALGDSGLLPTIVDPGVIFGQDTSFAKPWPFIEKGTVSPARQMASNIMPSAFLNAPASLKPKESKTWTSYFGFAPSLNDANVFASVVKAERGYFARKRSEMKTVYEDLVGHFGLATDIDGLNQYGRATFLDNVLRGGFPVSFGANGPIMHLYSRKHGDMERDYNAFQISATYYSQGNANFRDVNQNRRNDIFLNPLIGTTNIDLFFNLLQLDGYNPLVINAEKYALPRDFISQLELSMTDECNQEYHQLIKEPVLAGTLYDFLKRHAQDPLDVNNYFRDIIASSKPLQSVQHGEGFWTDHWTYNLDHLDQYLSVFPDKLSWLLFEKNDFTYYDNDHFVKPRREKYVLTKDGGLRQYDAVMVSDQKKQLISSRASDANKVRVDGGKGEIFKTNLFTKLLALAAVKIATLDPAGVGIEMEADKPGWCDALNGCPGLFGSSSHEMFELHRLVKFLAAALPFVQTKSMDLPVEIANILRDVQSALESRGGSDFRPVWDKLALAREGFREKTFFGVAGKPRNVRLADIKAFLSEASGVLSEAERKVFDPKTGLPASYFTYDVVGQKFDDGWRQYLGKLPFVRHNVAPFLEGTVHAMKLAAPARAKALYASVRRSALHDVKLGMYKLNVSLAQESDELGRVRIFSPGWLENESIFLHMHYKYLLEVLRSGQVDAFLEEIETGLIPFRNAEVYGRPTFENSSFLASSSFPDSDYHGRGFVARLSGATSEFLSMIYFMAFGGPLFRNVDGHVFFAPEPLLPREWFTKSGPEGSKHTLSLKLFGVPVTYLNPSRKNTFGKGAVKPVKFEWILDGRFYDHKGATLTPDASLALRESRLESLTIFLD